MMLNHSGSQSYYISNAIPRRPLSIAELVEKASSGLHDDLKHLLRRAGQCRESGKECAQRGDLEGAFVELTRAGTLMLDKVPCHPDYNILLNAEQRHNLALHGQEILDTLAEIKPTLVERYDKWSRSWTDGLHQKQSFNAQEAVNFGAVQMQYGEDMMRAYDQQEAMRLGKEETRKSQAEQKRKQHGAVSNSANDNIPPYSYHNTLIHKEADAREDEENNGSMVTAVPNRPGESSQSRFSGTSRPSWALVEEVEHLNRLELAMPNSENFQGYNAIAAALAKSTSISTYQSSAQTDYGSIYFTRELDL